ncbi:MAG: hypothetical protein AAFU78_15405 [Cyanobacteria bacterium J06633_2]
MKPIPITDFENDWLLGIDATGYKVGPSLREQYKDTPLSQLPQPLREAVQRNLPAHAAHTEKGFYAFSDAGLLLNDPTKEQPQPKEGDRSPLVTLPKQRVGQVNISLLREDVERVLNESDEDLITIAGRQLTRSKVEEILAS